jgi:hypothetical protein
MRRLLVVLALVGIALLTAWGLIEPLGTGP